MLLELFKFLRLFEPLMLLGRAVKMNKVNSDIIGVYLLSE